MEDPATSVPPSIWPSLNGWFTSTVFFVLLNLMIATIVFTSNLPTNNQETHEEEEGEQKKNPDNHRNQSQIARSPSILHRLKSFNFSPNRSEHESSPDSELHRDPLQEAATQYVFDQPLQYQHFDFDPPISDEIATAGDQFSGFNQTHEPRDTETLIVWEERENSVETVTTHLDYDPINEKNRINTGFEDVHGEEEQEQDGELQSLDDVYSKVKGERVDRKKSDGELPPKPPAKMKKSASLKVSFSHSEEEEIIEARRPATVRERKSAVSATEDEDDVEVDAKADDFINKFKNDLKLQRIESMTRTKGATSIGTAK